jgi:hypothetical protein
LAKNFVEFKQINLSLHLSRNRHDSKSVRSSMVCHCVSLRVRLPPAWVPAPNKNETSTLYFGFLSQFLQLERDKTVTFSPMAPIN